MYGQFNAKYLFMGSILVFEVGSAICGAAPTMNTLIVGRTICGLGGSGIYLGCMNILSVLTTDQERPAYLSLVGFMWGIGTV
jgi:MFS family permease